MDKEYMLFKVRERIKELERRYRIYCSGKNLKGVELIPATAALKRCEVKRDIQMLILIEQLLMVTSNSVFVTDQDAIDGFNRLVEPNERVNR